MFDRANAQNILKFLQDYVLLRGIPREITLDQAKCLIRQQIKAFCSHINIQLIEAPIHDHRAIGLVGRLEKQSRVVYFLLKPSRNQPELDYHPSPNTTPQLKMLLSKRNKNEKSEIAN